jgi:hypothetical protein
MRDLIDSIRIHIYQRLSSPLFGSFAIAWVCWNHQYLLILAANEPIQARLQIARMLVYPDTVTLWLRGFVWPALCAVLFILAYPYPSKLLFGYWHKRQVELKKLRDQIEGETLLTREESRKIILDSVAQRTNYEEQIARQARELEALRGAMGKTTPLDEGVAEQQRQRIAALESEVDRLRGNEKRSTNDPLANLDQALLPVMQKLLSIFAQNDPRSLEEAALLSNLGEPPSRGRYLLDVGRDAGLLEQIGSTRYRLTTSGRAFVVKSGLVK